MLSDSKYINTPTINTPIIVTPTVRNWDGWVDANETWTYASATTFTISGDQRGKYQKGDKIKLTQTTVKYFYIRSVSYSAPNTTVTITGGIDYTLVSAVISANFYSKVENPQGFPDWFNYTPTFSASGSMTYSSISITHAKFSIKGRTVHVDIRATGTTGGTASNTLLFTLPIEAIISSTTGTGVFSDPGNIGVLIFLNSTTECSIRRYDSTNLSLGASRAMVANAVYEMA